MGSRPFESKFRQKVLSRPFELNQNFAFFRRLPWIFKDFGRFLNGKKVKNAENCVLKPVSAFFSFRRVFPLLNAKKSLYGRFWGFFWGDSHNLRGGFSHGAGGADFSVLPSFFFRACFFLPPFIFFAVVFSSFVILFFGVNRHFLVWRWFFFLKKILFISANFSNRKTLAALGFPRFDFAKKVTSLTQNPKKNLWITPFFCLFSCG